MHKKDLFHLSNGNINHIIQYVIIISHIEFKTFYKKRILMYQINGNMKRLLNDNKLKL